MKLVVFTDGPDGPVPHEYDIQETLQNVSLGNLDILQKSTKDGDYKGTTRKSIKELFVRLGDQEIARIEQWKSEHPGLDPMADDSGFAATDGDDYLADPDFRASMIGLIFLGRRVAGENATVQDAADTPISRFFLKPDPEEIEEEADPKDEPVDDLPVVD